MHIKRKMKHINAHLTASVPLVYLYEPEYWYLTKSNISTCRLFLLLRTRALLNIDVGLIFFCKTTVGSIYPGSSLLICPATVHRANAIAFRDMYLTYLQCQFVNTRNNNRID